AHPLSMPHDGFRASQFKRAAAFTLGGPRLLDIAMLASSGARFAGRTLETSISRSDAMLIAALIMVAPHPRCDACPFEDFDGSVTFLTWTASMAFYPSRRGVVWNSFGRA